MRVLAQLLRTRDHALWCRLVSSNGALHAVFNVLKFHGLGNPVLAMSALSALEHACDADCDLPTKRPASVALHEPWCQLLVQLVRSEASSSADGRLAIAASVARAVGALACEGHSSNSRAIVAAGGVEAMLLMLERQGPRHDVIATSATVALSFLARTASPAALIAAGVGGAISRALAMHPRKTDLELNACKALLHLLHLSEGEECGAVCARLVHEHGADVLLADIAFRQRVPAPLAAAAFRVLRALAAETAVRETLAAWHVPRFAVPGGLLDGSPRTAVGPPPPPAHAQAAAAALGFLRNLGATPALRGVLAAYPCAPAAVNLLAVSGGDAAVAAATCGLLFALACLPSHCTRLLEVGARTAAARVSATKAVMASAAGAAGARSPSSRGWVYFLVEHPWQGLVKIGKAKDAAADGKAKTYPAPWNRIVSEVAGNPRMLVCWWAIRAENPDELERSLHAVLAPRQVSCGGGVEWYALTLGELEALRHVLGGRPIDGARAEVDIFAFAARAVAASDALAGAAGESSAAAAADAAAADAAAADAAVGGAGAGGGAGGGAAPTAAAAARCAAPAADGAVDAALGAGGHATAAAARPRLLYFAEAMREHGSEARLVHMAAVKQHVTATTLPPCGRRRLASLKTRRILSRTGCELVWRLRWMASATSSCAYRSLCAAVVDFELNHP